MRLFPTVDEAMGRMLEAIDRAEKSIRFEYYIFRASPIGEQFRDGLLRACRRGVRVQVLLDALGSISIPGNFWDEFTTSGGSLRWFNPLHFGRLSFRDHRKMLVCDDALAFVSGFNIGPEYQGDGVARGWHDTGAQLAGPLAVELGASFDAMFELADFPHRRFTRLRKSSVKKAKSTRDGQLLVSAPGRGRNFLTAALMEDFDQAALVQILCGYFLPPRQVRRKLIQAARRGVDVHLILAGKSDVAISQMASRRLYQGLLSRGIQIYEYQPQILHSKLYIFDHAVYTGSANLDKRSLSINYELLVRVTDTSVIAAARAIFQNAQAHSTRIDRVVWRSSRTFWQKLKEQWAYFVLWRLDPYVTSLQVKFMEGLLDTDYNQWKQSQQRRRSPD